MLFMVLISFLLTGLISMYHFSEENEAYHRERLRRKDNAIEANIRYFLRANPDKQNKDSIISLFSDKVCEISDIHGLDLGIYDDEGKLLITSNPTLIDRNVLTEHLSTPIVVHVLDRESQTQVLDKTEFGEDIHVLYTPLLNDYDVVFAILAVPYFGMEKLPEQDLEFMQTLFSIYMLLFIGAAALAYFLSNYITHSLTVIGEKMRQVKLNKSNEHIPYSSDDEIGELIREYNMMISVLEENAVLLARSERESAWKEMARQVAHEIKNPLTPMRLNVQLVERNKESLEGDKLKEFTEAMLGQIDALAGIAEAFSRFAHMPEAHLQEVNFNDFADRVKGSYPGVTIHLPKKPILVIADPELLLRIMNNLIRNAQQAVKDGEVPKIVIEFVEEDTTWILSCSDNGCGISEDKLDKIFEPNFTTKSSGMGLGLAMVKNLVESFGGKIWVRSEVEFGTTFSIRLRKSQS